LTKEKLINHLEHLREKHEKLDHEIDHMEATNVFADDNIHNLKKQRLALRDEMEATSLKIADFEKAA